jgi:hypothetical protein
MRILLQFKKSTGHLHITFSSILENGDDDDDEKGW